MKFQPDKITTKQAQQIRRRYVPGVVSLKELAKEYNVSSQMISLIINNKSHHDSNYIPLSSTSKKVDMELVKQIRIDYLVNKLSMGELYKKYKDKCDNLSHALIRDIVKNKIYVDSDYRQPLTVRSVSPEKVDLIISMVNKGDRISDIVKRSKLIRATVVSIIKRLKLKPKHNRHVVSPEQKETILKLNGEGKTKTFICKQVGLSKPTVLKVIQANTNNTSTAA